MKLRKSRAVADAVVGRKSRKPAWLIAADKLVATYMIEHEFNGPNRAQCRASGQRSPKRQHVIKPDPGRMTAEQRRARNARRLNARQLVGVVSHLKHIGMTEPEIREFLRTGGRAA